MERLTDAGRTAWHLLSLQEASKDTWGPAGSGGCDGDTHPPSLRACRTEHGLGRTWGQRDRKKGPGSRHLCPAGPGRGPHSRHPGKAPGTPSCHRMAPTRPAHGPRPASQRCSRKSRHGALSQPLRRALRWASAACRGHGRPEPGSAEKED
eukprot:bmy_08932T0